MTRLTLVALVAAVTLASSGAAFAGPIKIYPGVLKLLNGKPAANEVTSPGDAFYPQTATVDVRGECLAAGGTPKRQFDGTDFVWTCRQ